jgi:hypothetical protein
MEARSGASLGVVEFGGAQALEKLRNVEAKLLEIQNDLQILEVRLGEKRNDREQRMAQTSAHDRNLQSLQDDMRRLQETEAAEKRSFDAKQARMKELQSRTKKNVSNERKLVKDREVAETELLQSGKKYFVAISEELGVPDIRELMLQEEAERKRHQQEVDELEDRLREYHAREQHLG